MTRSHRVAITQLAQGQRKVNAERLVNTQDIKVIQSAENAERVILKAILQTVHICYAHKVCELCVCHHASKFYPNKKENNNGSVLKLDGDIPCGIFQMRNRSLDWRMV